jgi:predicted nucleic acid-binding protein
MIVVSDTTPLNYLILTETVHVLPAIFGRVYAPSAVIKELSHPRSPEAVRTWASSPPEWLDVQDPTHNDSSIRLGPGETAVISLALELEAGCVLIDERKGYKAAQQRGLKVITTLGIVEEAAHRGKEIRPNPRRLTDPPSSQDRRLRPAPEDAQVTWGRRANRASRRHDGRGSLPRIPQELETVAKKPG